MRVLLTGTSFISQYGGPARSVSGLAKSLTLSGMTVGVWAPDGSAEGADLLDGLDLRILPGSLEQALEVFGSADIIHDSGIWLRHNHLIARVACRRKIPRVVSPRGMLEPWALNYRKWKKRMAWFAYQRRDLQSADGLHATVAREAEQFRDLGLRAPIAIVPNGVKMPEVAGTRIPGSEKTALFLSRIHPVKGLPILVEAWSRLRPENWRMRVVGPDEDNHLTEVQYLVQQAGLEESWDFGEAVGEVGKWRALQEADLFILPSYSENFGIVVAEALASGTPVITTTGTTWEGLQQHNCGWRVEPESDAIAEALGVASRLSADKLSLMGARGKEWIEKDFAWPSIAEKMEEFYCEILERQRER